MLDHRLTHVVLQLAFLAVVVNGVVTAAAAAAAAAVDAACLLCLDEHVTHSLQSHTPVTTLHFPRGTSVDPLSSSRVSVNSLPL